MNTDFLGLNNFVWWFGVVENRLDPLELGRCQVRCFGWHTEDINQLPIEKLPWAHPIIPYGNKNVQPPAEGILVFGFFADGKDGQYPIIIGTVPGIPDEIRQNNMGFTDPYTDEQKAQPLFMATQCSAYVQKSITQDESLASHNKASVEECIGLVEQVGQLINDYEVVVKEFATTKSEASDHAMPSVMAPDGFVDVEPSVESLYGSDATEDESAAELGYDSEQDSKKGISPKAIAITVAIGVLVVGALLEGLGAVADGKAADHKSSVWQFFSSVRPSQFLSKSKTV
jgi:hypothetical protein